MTICACKQGYVAVGSFFVVFLCLMICISLI